MRLCLSALIAASFLAPVSALHAQVQKFPYAATIGGDDVYVRSGPGRKYYPTGKLSTGAHVAVHRHDPGGWYMIAPPEGSFSWISADALKPAGNRRALVAANNVPVLVGSAIGDVRDVEQVRLSVNDEVQLLDDVSVAGPNGSKMFRVVPPRGEYRWILGQFVVPMDETVRRQHDRDPFATPSSVRPPVSASPFPEVAAKPRATTPAPEPSLPDVDEQGLAFEEKPAAPPAPVASPPVAPVAANVAQQQWERLRSLDALMQTLAQADISQWNVAELEQGYRELQKTATVPTIVNAIPGRLATLANHAELKAEYDDFIRLTEATARRDAELAALQGSRGTTTVGFRPQPTPAASIPQTPQPAVVNAPATPTETVVIGQPSPLAVSSKGPGFGAPATLQNLVPVPNPAPNQVILQTPVPAPNPSAPTMYVLGPNGVPIPVVMQTPATAQPPAGSPPMADFRQVPSPMVVTVPDASTASTASPMNVLVPNPVLLQGPFVGNDLSEGTVPNASVVSTPNAPPGDASSDPNAEVEGFLPPVVRSTEPAPGTVPGYPLPRGTLPQQRGTPSPLARGVQPPFGATGLQPAPQFAGAGIIQKTRAAAPGMPQYVLIAPQGRVLAFLQPQPGVNLDPHVGQPMGVSGQRTHRPDLRGDLISVQDLTPVRLTPQ